jgi:excisionase family DNA binding protein
MSAIHTPTATMQPATMTITEVAALLGISRSAAYRAVARGEIPTIRIGRRLLVPTAKLYAMLGWTTGSTEYAATVSSNPACSKRGGPPPLEITTSQPVEDDASHLVIPNPVCVKGLMSSLFGRSGPWPGAG